MNTSKRRFIENEVVKLIKSGKLPSGGKMPSLRQLARKYRVSKSTMHQVFSSLESRGYITIIPGKGAFPHDLKTIKRKRVRENCISFVYPNMMGELIPEIFRGIERVAARENYYLASFDSLDDLNLERENLKKAIDIGSRGIVLFPVLSYNSLKSNYDIFIEIQKAGLPLVFVDNYPLHLDVDYVVANDFRAFYDLTKVLIKNGHAKIAFYGGPTHISSLRERQKGYWQAMRDAGLDVDSRFVYPNMNAPAEAEAIKSTKDFMTKSAEHFKSTLSSKNPPTAVILVHYSPEHVEILRESHLHIPKNLSVCSFIAKKEQTTTFFMRRFVQYIAPLDITHVYQPALELGEKAAEVVLDKIDNPQGNTVKIEIKAPIYLGSSVKKIGRARLLEKKNVSPKRRG